MSKKGSVSGSEAIDEWKRGGRRRRKGHWLRKTLVNTMQNPREKSQIGDLYFVSSITVYGISNMQIAWNFF